MAAELSERLDDLSLNSGEGSALPPIYTINLDSAVGRRSRMDARFQRMNLKVTYIKAYSSEDPIVDIYLRNYPDQREIVRREAACLASHLKALKAVVNSGEKGGIIMEDDLLFSPDYVRQASKKLEMAKAKTKEKGLPLDILLFGYMAESWEGSQWLDEKEGLGLYGGANLWGCQCFFVSAEFAKVCLREYSRPFLYLSGRLTSEMIIRHPQTIFCYPPLIAEECLDSTIRNFEEVTIYHKKIWDSWNFVGYS